MGLLKSAIMVKLESPDRLDYYDMVLIAITSLLRILKNALVVVQKWAHYLNATVAPYSG